jgi:hypothetical protein
MSLDAQKVRTTVLSRYGPGPLPEGAERAIANAVRGFNAKSQGQPGIDESFRRNLEGLASIGDLPLFRLLNHLHHACQDLLDGQ